VMQISVELEVVERLQGVEELVGLVLEHHHLNKKQHILSNIYNLRAVCGCW
jgi:hypothetical protein